MIKNCLSYRFNMAVKIFFWIQYYPWLLGSRERVPNWLIWKCSSLKWDVDRWASCSNKLFITDFRNLVGNSSRQHVDGVRLQTLFLTVLTATDVKCVKVRCPRYLCCGDDCIFDALDFTIKEYCNFDKEISLKGRKKLLGLLISVW